MKEWIFRLACLGGGFIAGTVANNLVEQTPSFPLYGKVIVEPLRGDDLILILLGFALVFVASFIRQPLLAWFGAGFILAIIVDEIAEAM